MKVKDNSSITGKSSWNWLQTNFLHLLERSLSLLCHILSVSRQTRCGEGISVRISIRESPYTQLHAFEWIRNRECLNDIVWNITPSRSIEIPGITVCYMECKFGGNCKLFQPFSFFLLVSESCFTRRCKCIEATKRGIYIVYRNVRVLLLHFSREQATIIILILQIILTSISFPQGHHVNPWTNNRIADIFAHA